MRLTEPTTVMALAKEEGCQFAVSKSIYLNLYSPAHNMWNLIKHEIYRKARINDPLSREKSINRTRFRFDPGITTIRHKILSNYVIILKVLEENVDNIYGQIGNFNRKMDTIKSQVKMLEIKTKTITETRFNFGLIIRLKN